MIDVEQNFFLETLNVISCGSDNEKNTFVRLAVLCCGIFCLQIPVGAFAAAEKAEMAFAPFVINSPKDMSYLQAGLREMLVSRLSAEAGIVAVDKAKIDDA